MNVFDFVIVTLLAAVLFFAVRRVSKKRTRGNGCCGCDGCSRPCRRARKE